jgi:hypothetical protein
MRSAQDDDLVGVLKKNFRRTILREVKKNLRMTIWWEF